ncbi:MAG: ferredoxin, partial [Gemmatimonadota bacterium]
AELELAGEYEPQTHEPFFTRFDWRQFSDEEFKLCPPIFAVGGDGAMLDIGFQNVSRLMASGKPIRVIVLDTQVYSNTGGQACTSGFTGQVSDMAAFGKDQHGKQEVRKEMSLIAMAHRGTFVLQSSQALPSHMLAGVIKGLNSKRPAVFVLHCPCPPEHGLGDDQAMHAAKLSLESRAFPFLVFDPDAGYTWSECLELEGNPEIDEDWPSYELKYLGDDGQEQTMELPLTIADWAATEARFKKHFKKVAADAAEDELIAFHEYLKLPKDERNGQVPFIYVIDREKRLQRLSSSPEMVELAEERLHFWSQLRELAGIKVTDEARSVLESELEEQFEKKVAELRAEYEARLADLKARYPIVVARRLAEGLLRGGNGKRTVADILSEAQSMPGLGPVDLDVSFGGPAAAAGVAVATPAVATAPAAAAPAVEAKEEEEVGLVMEPYIETARCTSCNECTNINKKMFAYDNKKQAYIKDPKAGTFKELVTAAERCPVKIIHPGTPLNPKEKDLDKLIKRAEPFN